MTLSLEAIGDTEQLVGVCLQVLVNLALALTIFFVGKWIAQGLIRLLRSAMRRWRVDETLGDFLCNVSYGVAIAVIVVAAAGSLGLDTTSLAAVVAGAALAIGLSLQNQLSSFAAGVIIILFRPFSKGDFVEIGGVKGEVEEIKIVSTQLRTADNKTLIVPNASITTNIITNYTARKTRRVELLVSISYGSDLLKARQVLEDIVAQEPRVLKDPEPSVRVRDLGQSSVDFDVWAWTRTDDVIPVRAQLLQTIKLRFDAEGVDIPFPQMDVRVHQA